MASPVYLHGWTMSEIELTFGSLQIDLRPATLMLVGNTLIAHGLIDHIHFECSKSMIPAAITRTETLQINAGEVRPFKYNRVVLDEKTNEFSVSGDFV